MICVVCYHVIHVVYDAYLFDVCCGVYDVFMICVLFLVVCVCVCDVVFNLLLPLLQHGAEEDDEQHREEYLGCSWMWCSRLWGGLEMLV